jgi:hypothetical protein
MRRSKAHKKPESAMDKAARRTAIATVFIAVFTAALVWVSWKQYQEVIDSSDAVDRMNRIYREQAAQLGRQAGDTHDLAIQAKNQADRTKNVADRMKDQADQTRIVANQAIVQANAAKNAAQTAQESLSVSERAYLILSTPIDDFPHKRTDIPIVNSGHIPSGVAKIVTHEVTFRLDDPSARSISFADAIEWHWKAVTYQTIPVVPNGNLISVEVNLPSLDQDRLTTGKQAVAIVAQVIYNDGFPNTPDQSYLFCDQSSYIPSTKLFIMRPCDDADAILRSLVTFDKYPSPDFEEK